MKGQCLCGSVAFAFEGPLSDIQICHCTRCRRATGAAFAAEVRVRADGFRWLRGQNLISHFDAPVLRDPPAYRRSFCSRCGSAVPVVPEGESKVCIPTGLIDGAISARPAEHIWYAKRANWLNFAELDALPKFEGDPG
jgi:hypothetical protein